MLNIIVRTDAATEAADGGDNITIIEADAPQITADRQVVNWSQLDHINDVTTTTYIHQFVADEAVGQDEPVGIRSEFAIDAGGNMTLDRTLDFENANEHGGHCRQQHIRSNYYCYRLLLFLHDQTLTATVTDSDEHNHVEIQ